MFKPQPLKFKQNALEPFLSEKTVHFHYDKHTKGYFEKMNKLIKDTTYENAKTLEDVVKRSTAGSKLYHDSAQAWNHDFYWNCLTDKKTDPSDELMKQFGEDFQSFNEFKRTFVEKGKGVFGSGWCWLVYVGGKLDILPRTGAKNPLSEVGTTKVTTLLVADVWEHAYYLDYQNEREKYLKKFFDHVNWDFVNEQYGKATKEKSRKA